jgi:hypothetical protein
VRAKRAEQHGQKAGNSGNAGGRCVGHNGNQSVTGALLVKFNNLCSFVFIRA